MSNVERRPGVVGGTKEDGEEAERIITVAPPSSSVIYVSS